jgi:probable HAF family extracellular repeat protein
MTLTTCDEGATNFCWCALLAAALSLLPLQAAAQTWVPTDIGTIFPTESTAVAASDTGVVVGTYTTAAATTHGFVWAGGSGWNDPGTLGGTTTIPSRRQPGRPGYRLQFHPHHHPCVPVDGGRRHGGPRHSRRYLQPRKRRQQRRAESSATADITGGASPRISVDPGLGHARPGHTRGYLQLGHGRQ